jgi:hypothetical protein
MAPCLNATCWIVTRVSSAWKFGLSKRRIWTELAPSSVIRFAPSITVSVSSGRFIVCVTVIVTGSVPQSNVITPPALTAALSAANVQLAAVPVPTTVVGCEMSTGLAAAGTPARHVPSGLPFGLATVPGASAVGPASPSWCDDEHAHANNAIAIEALIPSWSQGSPVGASTS